MKTRLMHVRANVRNLEQAIEWYTKTLGFEVMNRWPPQNPIYAEFTFGEGAQFSIAEDQPVPTGGRFNFSVKDVDDLWEKLKGQVEVVEPLYDTSYGQRKFTIQDLDGNELGFIKG